MQAKPAFPLPLGTDVSTDLTVIFLDAGQGDCTLVVYPDGSLVLVDCGSIKNSNIIRTEVEQLLSHYLVPAGNKLKAMVLTHPDRDHYNLVKPFIVDKNVKIGTLFYGGNSNDYGQIASWIECSGGGNIQQVYSLPKGFFNPSPIPALSYIGSSPTTSVQGRILAANVGDPKVKGDANPNSVVILLTFDDINIFLMGDSTTQTEEFILNWDKTNKELTTLLNGRHTALKAGHHGSNTSSGSAWIKKIRPEVVFISSDTRTFSGVSIPRSGVINRILSDGAVVQVFPNNPNAGAHHYVQYNDDTDRHEAVATTQAVCTTLYLLQFNPPNNDTFTAYGTSWVYTISVEQQSRNVSIVPTVGWSKINVA